MRPKQGIFLIGVALLCQFCQSPQSSDHAVKEAIARTQQCVPSPAIPQRRPFPVNSALDPCDNLYQYACSKALACFKLREDRSSHVFAFNDSAERLLDKKKNFLKTLSSETHANSTWSRSLANFYAACTNAEAGKIEEKTEVQQTLTALEHMKSRKALLDFFADQNLASKVGLIDYGSTSDLEDADRSDIIVDPSPLMNLPERSYYHNPEMMSAFENLIADFFQTLGLSNAKKRAHEIVKFEKGLAESYPLPEEVRKLANEKRYVKRAKMIRDLPNLRLDKILQPIPHAIVFRDLFPASLKHVNRQFSALSLQTLKDIYTYNALSPLMDDAYPHYFAKKFEFNKKFLGGANKRPERDERCAMGVMSNFGKELDHELIEKLFPTFPTEKFEHLVEKIRVSMVDRIEKNSWLSARGREGALRKLRAIKMRLVKPKNAKEWDLQRLGDYRPDTRIANSVQQRKLSREKMLEELSKKRNRDAWEMNPLMVNAYYDPSNNTFNMPMGILQYPFFDGELKDYENFGAVGVVVGHEIGHAFDDNGAKFNELGVLQDWMTPEDLQNFKRLGSILVEQYNKAGHNGQLTLGENIADTTGLNFSYGAAFPNGEGTKEAKQGFFLQWARAWCGTMRDTEYQRRIKLDPHSQTEVRVNEPVKHQKGFYDAFSCKTGDKMFLPEDKRLQMW